MEGQIIIIAQILNGMIDPAWVIVALLGFNIWLGKRILNGITDELKIHRIILKEHGEDIAAMKRAEEILLPGKYRKKKGDKGEN